MNIFEKLVAHFGTQVKTAAAVGVDQTTVSGWVTGKRRMSAITALRVEQVTNGAFKAIELCPALGRVQSAA